MKLHFYRVACVAMFSTALLSGTAFAQMFATSGGNTQFSASTPLENIEAENKKSQVILNTANNEIAIRMNMREFSFPNKLMQEHFNENYMESSKYPKSTFKGKIVNLDQINFTQDGTYPAEVSGDLRVGFELRSATGKQKAQPIVREFFVVPSERRRPHGSTCGDPLLRSLIETLPAAHRIDAT